MQTTSIVLRALGLPRPYAQSTPLRIESISLDPPAEGEVLVKVVGAGLCRYATFPDSSSTTDKGVCR